jgi:type II restriction enzyme
MTGKKQASGNAIERLGKNVIGFRTWMMNEEIFPFICFGWGWDFNSKCTIRDRVVTIAQFGQLNKTYLFNTKKTNRGSFYFDDLPLTNDKMLDVMLDIAKRSIHYYFSKYGEENFLNS